MHGAITLLIILLGYNRYVNRNLSKLNKPFKYCVTTIM